MSARKQVSGIVLAGGMSRRLGRNKAVEPLGGVPLIERVLSRLSQITSETVVVVADDRRASELPLPEWARVALDIYPDCGSLGGIFTGLTAAEAEWGIVVACDMPFLNVRLLRQMLGESDGFDAVVPVVDGHPEPTHAVYSKECLPFIERRLRDRDLKIARFFDEVRVNYYPQADVQRADPELRSFFNVNTQEDLDLALAIEAQGQEGHG